MRANMGNKDRMVRIALAVVFGLLIATNVVSGWLAGVMAVLSIVFVLTSVVSFCPLYVPFHFSTRQDKLTR